MKKCPLARCPEDSGCPGNSFPAILHPCHLPPPFQLAFLRPPVPIGLVVSARPSRLSCHIDTLIILPPYGQRFTTNKAPVIHLIALSPTHHHFTLLPLVLTHCPPGNSHCSLLSNVPGPLIISGLFSCHSFCLGYSSFSELAPSHHGAHAYVTSKTTLDKEDSFQVLFVASHCFKPLRALSMIYKSILCLLVCLL